MSSSIGNVQFFDRDNFKLLGKAFEVRRKTVDQKDIELATWMMAKERVAEHSCVRKIIEGNNSASCSCHLISTLSLTYKSYLFGGLAGTPAAIVNGGIVPVTAALSPTTDLSPILDIGQNNYPISQSDVAA